MARKQKVNYLAMSVEDLNTLIAERVEELFSILEALNKVEESRQEIRARLMQLTLGNQQQAMPQLMPGQLPISGTILPSPVISQSLQAAPSQSRTQMEIPGMEDVDLDPLVMPLEPGSPSMEVNNPTFAPLAEVGIPVTLTPLPEVEELQRQIQAQLADLNEAA